MFLPSITVQIANITQLVKTNNNNTNINLSSGRGSTHKNIFFTGSYTSWHGQTDRWRVQRSFDDPSRFTCWLIHYQGGIDHCAGFRWELISCTPFHCDAVFEHNLSLGRELCLHSLHSLLIPKTHKSHRYL